MIYCRIKDIARINTRTLPEDTDPEYSFHYIDIGAVDALGNIDITQGKTTFQNAPSRARRVAPPGSVIVSTVRTYLRAVASVPSNESPLIFSTGFAVLESGSQVDSRYLAYYCRSNIFIDEVVARSVGVSYPAINASEIGQLPIELPPLEEQRRIADFLDTETARIDKIARARQQQRVLLEERRSSAMTECVTYNEADARHHELVGHIAPEWPVLPLRRIVPAINVGVVINPSSYFTDEGVPFLHGFNVRSGYIDPTGMKYISSVNCATLRRSQIWTGDVLVVRAGSPGRASVVTPEYDGANCASVLILRKSKKVIPEFLAAFLNSPAGQGQVKFSQYGAAQEVISASQAQDFAMPLPDLEVQEARVRTLKESLLEIQHLEQRVQAQLDLLTERRAALISAAVTGELDVSTASGRE